MKIRQLSARQIYLIIFLAVGGLIGYAAYSIKILGLEPVSYTHLTLPTILLV